MCQNTPKEGDQIRATFGSYHLVPVITPMPSKISQPSPGIFLVSSLIGLIKNRRCKITRSMYFIFKADSARINFSKLKNGNKAINLHRPVADKTSVDMMDRVNFSLLPSFCINDLKLFYV